jgi:hypothetical protein
MIRPAVEAVGAGLVALTVRDLIDGLRYQIVCPDVTTMSLCPLGCGYSSRGGNYCSACVMKELTARIGVADADAVYLAHRNYADAGRNLRVTTERVLSKGQSHDAG